MKIAVFPGSFDPITKGHVDVIKRALPLFDRLIVAVGLNSQKKTLFSLDQRLEWLNLLFEKEPKIRIMHYHGLTVRFCAEEGAKYLIRGIRNASDFDYEKTISQINHEMLPELETIFFIAHPSLSHISSTIVRELVQGKADVSQFVPSVVKIPV